MLKAAVIGCGRMGAEPSSRLAGIAPAGWLPISHAEAVLEVEGLSLAALCDPDPARLQMAGQRYGVSALYADADRLLEDVHPEVVTIATRTPGKADLVRRAAEAGARVLYVEKPLANNLGEARAALEAVARAGAVIAYGVNRRYHAVYRHARQLLAAGVIGDVLDVIVEHGRVPLLWAHPHSVDLMLFLLGSTNVTSVQARLDEATTVRASEFVVDSDPLVEHAHFTFADGQIGSIVRAGGCTTRIGGTEGTLTIHADGSYLQVSRPRDVGGAYFLDQAMMHDAPASSATVVALRESIEAAQGRSERLPIRPEEIECGLRMLIGSVWSHLRNGAIVELAEVPAQATVTGRKGAVFA